MVTAKNITLTEVEKLSSVKYQVVRDALADLIRKGEFGVGDKMPSERVLAVRFGVNYMTVRRAVADLVESELLERRPRSGIYVRPQSREKLLTPTLNLICDPYESSITKAFLRYGALQAQQRGWRIRVTRMHQGYERPVARAIRDGEPTVALLMNATSWPDVVQAMKEPQANAVLVGSRLDHEGVPSVIANENESIHRAVEYLKSFGHRHSAFISNEPSHPVDALQIDIWKSSFLASNYKGANAQHVINIQAPDQECLMKYTYQKVRAFLESKASAQVTALLCIYDEMALGALAACRDAGRPVPERMSLINSGDSPFMEFACPPVTAIDLDIGRHMEVAAEILAASLAGTLASRYLLRQVTTRLVERQSVREPQRPSHP